MVKVVLSFNSLWILRIREQGVDPVESFLDCMKSFYNIEVETSSISECVFRITNENADLEDIKNRIGGILRYEINVNATFRHVNIKLFTDNSPNNEPFVFSFDENTPFEAPFKEQEELEPIEEAADKFVSENKDIEDTSQFVEIDEGPTKEERIEEILKEIDSLVGAEEFKALMKECVKVAPGLIKHNAVDAFLNQSYIFSINDGNGLSTYLNLFARLLKELEMFKIRERSIIETKIGAMKNNEPEKCFLQASKYFDRENRSVSEDKHRSIVCIDMSEWMSKVDDINFRNFLQQIKNCQHKPIVIFRIPFVEREVLAKIKYSINDILSVKDISFIPFDDSEICRCAEKDITNRGFVMDDDAWPIFKARILEEKNDGKFYGIKTVEKVVLEMIYLKELVNSENGVDDNIIKKSEILGITSYFDSERKSGMELLDGMVGMEKLRARIEEIVSQIEMAHKNKSLGHPCIHMRFVGNPGTGKTTVARVVGSILRERGILRNGNFFEHAGREFCGRYVGETAPKTAAMCRDAYGSVLFIDEAYTLYRGGESKVDYGREAIDTLIAEMENHRSDLVVIMAGYTDEMKELMKANPGLESRMPYIIEFPNYTREQLFEIYMQMADKSFSYTDDFKNSVKEYFNSLPDEVLSAKDFSNARFVRNLFERTWGKAILRSQLAKCECSNLTKEDFLLASGEKEFKKIMEKQVRTLGFI